MAQLVERDVAEQGLAAALAAARQGLGRTVLVFGEAGVGKTSLTRAWAAGAPEVRWLWGGCEALYSPRPLGPLFDMAQDLDAPTRGFLSQEGARTELFSAVLQQLHDPGRPPSRVTGMVVEDLHWADAATLDLVKFLARRIHRAPAVLVLTFRDDEVGESHPLRGVLGDLPPDTLVRIPLAPLSEAGVAELARRAERPAEGLFAATGGNPFFVTEAIRGEGLPASVRDAVLARAARQPPAVRAILDLASLVPGRIEAALVEAILSPGAPDISAALSSGLLVADARGYAFRHELARIALEQALPAPLAAALHGRLLAALRSGVVGSEGVAGARLVHHAAGAHDSRAVLELAPQAAEEAVAHGAHREAAALYAIALSHAGGLPPRARAELLERRAYRCYMTDQLEAAISARLSALAIWRALGDREQEGRTLRWLSRLSWFIGRGQDAERYSDEAIDLLQSLPPGRELAWALSNRSQLDMLGNRAEGAIAFGERAIAMAVEAGDDEILAHALNNVGAARYQQRDDVGLAMLERSLELSLKIGLGEHVARAYANLVSCAVVNRDYGRARGFVDAAMSYFATGDFDAWTHHSLAWQSRLEFEQGRWDRAEQLASGLLDRYGVAAISRIPALIILARLRRLRGDPGADARLDEAAALARESGEIIHLAPVAVAQAEAAWLRDDPSALPADFDGTWKAVVEGGYRRAAGELAFWRRQLGLPLETPELIEPPYRLLLSGDGSGAVAAWAELGCAYEEALARLEGDEAGVHRGLEILSTLGARAVDRRYREQLRFAGVRGLARGPRASTQGNPAGLTNQEIKILVLLAKGLTNPEIASRLGRSTKTVDHHVSAILRKLEARSRAEAAVLASRMGLT